MAKLNVKSMTKALTQRGLGSAVGGAASMAVNKVIPASINPKLRGIGKIVLGAILPELAPKSKLLDYAGAGFTGVAGAELAGELIPALKEGAVKGIGNDSAYVIDEDSAQVSGDVDVINGDEGVEVVIEGAEEDPII
jgi:hypothetical protein